MCESKAEAGTKIDRLIAAVERLTEALDRRLVYVSGGNISADCAEGVAKSIKAIAADVADQFNRKPSLRPKY
jgi:hypothetical protein